MTSSFILRGLRFIYLREVVDIRGRGELIGFWGGNWNLCELRELRCGGGE